MAKAPTSRDLRRLNARLKRNKTKKVTTKKKDN
jgi:hypothetical protein